MNALMMGRTLCFCAGLAWASALAAQESQPASQPSGPEVKSDPAAVAVVERYLEALGGKERLAGIKTRKMEFSNKKFSPTGVTEMKMVRYLKRPVSIREEWELPEVKGIGGDGEPLRFVQVYDGEKGWVKTLGFVSPLAGRTLQVFVWDKPIDDAFMNWKENGYTLKALPTSEVDGIPVDVVETIAFAGRQKMKYSFSKENGLLLKKEWYEKGAKGRLLKEVFYDEYTKIRFNDNPEHFIKVALNQKIFEDGELALEKSFQRISFNEPIADGVFARPEGPQFEGPKQKEKKKEATSKPKSRPASRPR